MKKTTQQYDYSQIMEAAKQYVYDCHPKMEHPESVADYMKPLLMDKEQEEFWVLMLDTKTRLIEAKIATIGLLDRSQIHAREVFRDAIVANCSRIIVCHNHPSGDPTPSPQDISCTKNLVAAGRIIGIEVIDHVIIGKSYVQGDGNAPTRGWLSFRENNIL
jgi:DNA repair protein RadC